MVRYLDRTGTSGVTAYELGRDFVRVEFEGEHVYRYTYRSAGRLNIERMKSLAIRGEGLNTFIDSNAKMLYEAKER
jgi:hypothetical protein